VISRRPASSSSSFSPSRDQQYWFLSVQLLRPRPAEWILAIPRPAAAAAALSLVQPIISPSHVFVFLVRLCFLNCFNLFFNFLLLTAK
jgi:hypothetical protein